MKRRVVVEVPVEIWEKLKIAAVKERKSMTAFVIEMIERWWKENKEKEVGG
ncbi:hypothetical protein J7L60_01875 [Candidatus Bathyarchaeota archaeon]|nr:hypothetical protein [Candidatus Bathyarchaeota archaeon]